MAPGPRITRELLRILTALLDEPVGAWYGLALANAAGLKTGTVYPALARLESAGWIESWWEDVDPAAAGRPRRRLYRLTGEGAIAARRVVTEEVAALSSNPPN